MKKIIFINKTFCPAVLISVFVLLPGILFSQSDSVPDYSQCLKKSSSAWGSKCSQCMNFENSYRVNLRNTCKDVIDVKVAVQETTRKWRTFLKSNVAPGDSVSSYACVGTGKYMFWARKGGDKSVFFPTDVEINLQNVK